MADSKFQVSGKDNNGNIFVVGGDSFEEYEENLQKWFSDPDDVEYVGMVDAQNGFHVFHVFEAAEGSEDR